MSSDAMTGAAGAATAPADLADASRRLLEQSFNTGNFELIDQLVAPEALNHDPALPPQMRDLRGRVSGLCQPTYVLDLPGGSGKIPVGPNYVQKGHESGDWRIEDPAGTVHSYPPRKFLAD